MKILHARHTKGHEEFFSFFVSLRVTRVENFRGGAMSNEYADYELDFFRAVDRNTRAEQAVVDALATITDDQYYTLFEIEAQHTCGWARIQVFPERSGTLYRCLTCGVSGIIGG
jgi:hypothetical protein